MADGRQHEAGMELLAGMDVDLGHTLQILNQMESDLPPSLNRTATLSSPMLDSDCSLKTPKLDLAHRILRARN